MNPIIDAILEYTDQETWVAEQEVIDWLIREKNLSQT